MYEETKSGLVNFLETGAIVVYLFSAFALNQVVWLLFVYLILYANWGLYILLIYFAWIYLDRNTYETGGRRSHWFRNCAWWKYHRSYFPVTLHKTAELPPDKNYLLPVVPHGVLAAGAYSAFGTDTAGFTDLFPGIVPYLSTLRIMFFLPVVRELMILSGLVSPSQRSLDWILGSPGVGRASVLVVGGAMEASYNQPGVYKTIIRQRKGFCRTALSHGSSLVPVVVFGEVDLYEVRSPEAGSQLHRIQMWLKRVTGVLPIRFVGQGWFSLLPKKKPIHVVVGSPLHVAKKMEVCESDVNELHQKFIENLVDLFESQKHKFLSNADQCKIEFV